MRLDEIGEDVVVLDCDANSVTTPFDDVEQLPGDVRDALRRRLRDEGKGANDALGTSVPRTFLRAMVALIGAVSNNLNRNKIFWSKTWLLIQRCAGHECAQDLPEGHGGADRWGCFFFNNNVEIIIENRINNNRK